MSNGAECCALEICCPDAATKRTKLTASIVAFTGAEPDHCAGFLDWMENNNLTFAPKEFEPVIQRIVTVTRTHPAE